MQSVQTRRPPSNIGAWCVALLLAYGLRGVLAACANLLEPLVAGLMSFLYRRVAPVWLNVPSTSVSISWDVVVQLGVSGSILILIGFLAGKRLLRE